MPDWSPVHHYPGYWRPEATAHLNSSRCCGHDHHAHEPGRFNPFKGEEKDLSLDSLRVVGRIAAREAVRLNAKHVAWAPVIRDQGNTAIDVGEGDRAFVEQMLAAYDTEKRLQAQALVPAFSIEDLVIEAGPTFFDSAVKQVSEGIESITGVLAERTPAPYVSPTK
jgi:hypothetical protein